MTARPPASSLKPRKLPGQRRSAATVAAILEAAARILETGGFDGYTTNAVAIRAGVSIGSLYQYFPGRDAITRALIERESAALLDDLELAAAEAEGREGLDFLLAAAVRHQLRRPKLARLLDVEESRLPMGADLQQIGERVADALHVCLTIAGFEIMKGNFVIGDTVAIIRGMVDAAGQRGETDENALTTRVRRAVFGYLERA